MAKAIAAAGSYGEHEVKSLKYGRVGLTDEAVTLVAAVKEGSRIPLLGKRAQPLLSLDWRKCVEKFATERRRLGLAHIEGVGR